MTKKQTDNETAEQKQQNENKAGRTTPKIVWDDSKMATNYANACNVTSSREEITLLFGTNLSWHGVGENIKVELGNRIILNPHAAKRLLIFLNATLGDYESRYGAIKLDQVEEKPESR